MHSDCDPTHSSSAYNSHTQLLLGHLSCLRVPTWVARSHPGKDRPWKHAQGPTGQSILASQVLGAWSNGKCLGMPMGPAGSSACGEEQEAKGEAEQTLLTYMPCGRDPLDPGPACLLLLPSLGYNRNNCQM